MASTEYDLAALIVLTVPLFLYFELSFCGVAMVFTITFSYHIASSSKVKNTWTGRGVTVEMLVHLQTYFKEPVVSFATQECVILPVDIPPFPYLLYYFLSCMPSK